MNAQRAQTAPQWSTHPCLSEVQRGGQFRDVDARQVVRALELGLKRRHLVLREWDARVASQLPLLHPVLLLHTCIPDPHIVRFAASE